ncbi:MAG TPA: protein-glutamate O-methyltransferase CheR [Gaiellaceae bacterium]|jgi:chemotaxis protein methyltransferase CheR
MSALAVTRLDDYELFCEGFRALTQIDLSQYKRGQMERRIRSFAQRRGLVDLRTYLGQLRSDAKLLDEFLDRVTINVSQLWRNPEQWTMLARDVLVELRDSGRIRAWSAGCSYGAEAYTLAALCQEVAPGVRVDIRGTDIDRRMVERAREGRFTVEDARSAPHQLLERWFDRDGDGWQAKRTLRSLVRFEVGDLLRMTLPKEHYDLVLCRNTVIYFNEDVRDALHARIAASLRRGGWFIVGATERVSQPASHGLELIRPFTYRKV